MARRVILYCAYVALAVVLPWLLSCASQLMLLPGLASPVALPQLDAPGRLSEVSVSNAAANRLIGALYEWPGDYGSVLVSGGNAMSRSATESYTRFLHAQGFRVLAFSFQGYDDNDGAARLESLPTDARAFYRYLRSQYPDEPVVYLASSISTVAAQCLPALEPELAGLVLEGAVDAPRIAFSKITGRPLLWIFLPLSFPVALGIWGDVPSAVSPGSCFRSARGRDVPALYLHHPKDAVVPYSGARSLQERYPGPSAFVDLEGPNHSPWHLLLGSDRSARESVLAFIKQQLGTRSEARLSR